MITDASAGAVAGSAPTPPEPVAPAPPVPGTKTSSRPLWWALFFASGAAGLIYEVLWMRRLCLVFGATQLAVATVLSSFMAGLAVGAWIGGRIADRMRRPALGYLAAEALIALWALAFPELVEVARGLYGRSFDPEATAFLQHQVGHLGFMFTLLLVPTAAMGATLPLLARALRLSSSGGEAVAGSLYGANTFGAVVGTWSATFLLLPTFGVRSSEFVAIGLNLIVAGIGWALVRSEATEEPGSVDALPSPDERPALGREGAIVLAVVTLSGVAAMALEVAWTRLLALVLGSSIYAFTWMLVAYLLGHAGGAALGARVRDPVTARRSLGLALLSAGACAAVATHAYPRMPFWFVDLYVAFGAGPGAVPWIQALLSAFALTPTTIGLGALFPLATVLVPDAPARFGRELSRVYVANTIGAASGALIAGFVLLPRLGLQNTLISVVIVLLVAGAVLYGLERKTPLRAVALAATVGAVLTGTRATWDPLLVSAGIYQYVTRLADWTDEAVRNQAVSDSQVLFHAEGTTTVVTVARSLGSGNIWLANNGKIDASTGIDMPTQVLLGHLPFLYRPMAEDALVVGLASGISAGAVTLHDRLKRIDVLEIEPAVILASRYFDEHNNRPLQDPRVRVLANDARNHLELYDGAYDVIINEPSNPWITGVSNLFTEEYLRLGRSRLSPRGVFVQWVQLYGMGLDDVRSLLETFSSIFPHTVAWSTIEDADLLLIGSRAELRFWPADVEEMLKHPRIGPDLRRAQIDDGFELLTSLVLDDRSLRLFSNGAGLNTDDNVRIETNAPKHLLRATSERNATALLDAASGPWPTYRRLLPTEADRVQFLLHLGEAWERRERWTDAALTYEEMERRGAPQSVVAPRMERVLEKIREIRRTQGP